MRPLGTESYSASPQPSPALQASSTRRSPHHYFSQTNSLAPGLPPGLAGSSMSSNNETAQKASSGFLSIKCRVSSCHFVHLDADSVSQIYLSDVHDHLDEVISSLALFSDVSENLISYTASRPHSPKCRLCLQIFSTVQLGQLSAEHEHESALRCVLTSNHERSLLTHSGRLVITVVFLPLTDKYTCLSNCQCTDMRLVSLLTGYFVKQLVRHCISADAICFREVRHSNL